MLPASSRLKGSVQHYRQVTDKETVFLPLSTIFWPVLFNTKFSFHAGRSLSRCWRQSVNSSQHRTNSLLKEIRLESHHAGELVDSIKSIDAAGSERVLGMYALDLSH